MIRKGKIIVGEPIILNLPSSGSLGELLQSLTELMNGISLEEEFLADFRSANFENFNPIEHIPSDLTRPLLEESYAEYERQMINRKPVSVEAVDRMNQVFANMISSETSLNLNESKVKFIPGSTRYAIKHLFDHFTRSGKSIALPIPSWQFWQDDFPGRKNFVYIDGRNEEHLVEGFRRVAKEGKVSALLLAGTANPLLYIPSEVAVRELNSIALKHGLSIIVDDVLRGTQPIGQRDSIARWITRPYIAEGLGHRLGDELTDLSFVMFPKNEPIDYDYGRVALPAQLSASKAVDLAVKYGSKLAVEELEARNREFDLAFNETKPKSVTSYRPYSSHLNTLIDFKSTSSMKALEFARELKQQRSVVVSPVEAFYPDNCPPKELKSTFRVSIGSLYRGGIAEGARELGRALHFV